MSDQTTHHDDLTSAVQDTASPNLGSKASRNYEMWLETANRFNALGNTSGAAIATRRANALATRFGLSPTNYNVNQFAAPEDWSQSALAERGALKLANQRGAFVNDRLDQRRNAFRVNQANASTAAMRKGYQQKYEPTLDLAQNKVNELAGTSAVSAQDESAMRSNLTSQIRTAESTRMARLGAALGISGMRDSPASAALAQQASEDADRTITSELANLRLRTAVINREQSRADADLAAKIVATRSAIETGDAKTLMGLQGDVASIIDAMYSRDLQNTLMEKAYKDSQSQSFLDRTNQYINTAKGLGSLAMTAGSLGSMGAGPAVSSGNYTNGGAFAYDAGGTPVPGPMGPRG